MQLDQWMLYASNVSDAKRKENVYLLICSFIYFKPTATDKKANTKNRNGYFYRYVIWIFSSLEPKAHKVSL